MSISVLDKVSIFFSGKGEMLCPSRLRTCSQHDVIRRWGSERGSNVLRSMTCLTCVLPVRNKRVFDKPRCIYFYLITLQVQQKFYTFYSLSHPQVHTNTHQIKCSWREKGAARRKPPAHGAHLRRLLSENLVGGLWWKDIYCTQCSTGWLVQTPPAHLSNKHSINVHSGWTFGKQTLKKNILSWKQHRNANIRVNSSNKEYNFNFSRISAV